MRETTTPFADGAPTDVEDLALVAQAKSGSRDALESLVRRHQAWIYNIVLRMLYWPHDAEDVTHEILIKVITKLSAFEGRSSFRTWLYRIVVNHVLNLKRRRFEEGGLNFATFAKSLDEMADLEVPDPRAVDVDKALIVKEAEVSCTMGMLLCLDREQRVVYVLGELFGVSDTLGAELLEISRDNFRQKLSRARRDLHAFLQNKCGLIDPANPCRCAKKAAGFAKAGYIDVDKPMFARTHLMRVRDVAPRARDVLEELDASFAELFRDQRFQDSPDFVAALRALIDAPPFKSVMEP